MDIAAFLALLACALGFGAWLIVREDDDEFRNPPRFSALTPPPFGSAEGPRAVDPPPAGAGPTSTLPASAAIHAGQPQPPAPEDRVRGVAAATGPDPDISLYARRKHDTDHP